MIIEAQDVSGDTVKRLFEAEKSERVEIIEATLHEAPLSQSVDADEVNLELSYDLTVWLDLEFEALMEVLPKPEEGEADADSDDGEEES